MVEYSIQAKKTKIKGHTHRIGLEDDVIEYDSRLEARVAQCLLKEGVKFRPHVNYRVFDRNGEPFNYTVDFDLIKPYKVSGVSELINAIEVKGVLNP